MTTPQQGQRRSAALEARRFEAARLFTQGTSQAAVMRRLRVSRQTAHRWYHLWRRRAWLVFEDESGVSQQPVVRRTWAPRGQTPVLIHTGGPWQRLSVAGALAFRWDGRRTRFYFQTCPGTYSAGPLIRFLRHLKRHFRGRPVTLIWDGLGAHTSRVMRAYLARQRGWLHVERLPGYAPELNPIEQVWGNVKVRELANVCAAELTALRRPLHNGFARVRRQSDLAFAFLRHTGLQL